VGRASANRDPQALLLHLPPRHGSRAGQPSVIQAPARHDDEHYAYRPEADDEGKGARYCASREDLAEGDNKRIDRGVYQYRQKYAGSCVVKHPRYYYCERSGGDDEQCYAEDAAAARRGGPRRDQKLGQMPQGPQHAQDNRREKRPVQRLHASKREAAPAYFLEQRSSQDHHEDVGGEIAKQEETQRALEADTFRKILTLRQNHTYVITPTNLLLDPLHRG
jgi:hypothetical protein